MKVQAKMPSSAAIYLPTLRDILPLSVQEYVVQRMTPKARHDDLAHRR